MIFFSSEKMCVEQFIKQEMQYIIKELQGNKVTVPYCVGGSKLEEQSQGYFEEALSNFTKDFAYGGAIRHLVDHGYTVDRIIKEFQYPISRESIEKIVNQYLKEKSKQRNLNRKIRGLFNKMKS